MLYLMEEPLLGTAMAGTSPGLRGALRKRASESRDRKVKSPQSRRAGLQNRCGESFGAGCAWV